MWQRCWDTLAASGEGEVPHLRGNLNSALLENSEWEWSWVEAEVNGCERELKLEFVSGLLKMWVQERNSAVKSGLKFHHGIVGQADLL